MANDRLARVSLAVVSALFAAKAALSKKQEHNPMQSEKTAGKIYEFEMKTIDGKPKKLSDYKGHPLLIVNTASQCGYTPQYAGLQELWTRYRDRGLLIVGVPSNDFGGQEPGGVAEITETANKEYGVTFPLAAKAEIVGPNAHPFYKWAASERPLETPKWNFHKYLVGRDGHIAAVFPTAVEPMRCV